MPTTSFNDGLFAFIGGSPTPFHAVSVIEQMLVASGFARLAEGDAWKLERGGRYVVTRDGSLVAFTLTDPAGIGNGFRVIGAHTDSPSLQIKPRLRQSESPYIRFGVETYGGALLSTWFDRELSVAGRVAATIGDGTGRCFLVDFRRPLVYIPSLAIHLNRAANDGLKINPQDDLSPLVGHGSLASQEDWEAMLRDEIKQRDPALSVRAVLGYDLFCYDCAAPCTFGAVNEFIAAPRLDNLLSCYVGVRSIAEPDLPANCMLILANHEEVGSTTSSGAVSNFADLVLARICGDQESRGRCLHNSLLLSLDNAHATHPNFSDKSDREHRVVLNHGPVIKINSAQRYCTTALSGALFRLLCDEAGIATQDFVMRSDMASGSTIGPLTTARLGIAGLDVGAPTLGMHSVREVTGVKDPELLFEAARHFLSRATMPRFDRPAEL